MPSPQTSAGRGRTDRRRLLPRLLALFVIGLGLLVALNAYVLGRETGKAHIRYPGATLVKTTSGPLQVFDTGPAPGPGQTAPLVLIHGTAGAIDWWDDLMPRLRAGHRLVALDLLGHGGSAKPDSGYSVRAQAGLVAQVLNDLRVDRAIVVGHSLGGSVATALALDSPRLVSGLVLIDSGPEPGLDHRGFGPGLIRTPVIGPLFWRLAPDALLRKALSPGFAPGTPVEPRYVDDLRAMTYPAVRQEATAGEEFTREGALPSRLQAGSVPLLVIFGEEDRIYPARESLSAYAGIPGVKTVLIPGSGHSPQIEAPDPTARAILEFSSELGRRERTRTRQARQRQQLRARSAQRAKRAARKARSRSTKPHRKQAGKRARPGGRRN